MNGKADPSAPDASAAIDPAFDRLMAEVARGPQPSLLAEGAAVGEYRIVKLLGRGAFGAVYHAAHVVIEKQVALKVLAAQFSQDATVSARFIDEARAVNRIAHPNIVDIFGFGMLPDGRKYCVMELLQGETLCARLERGALAAKPALEILTQVASALDAAHASSIVHRDLKPDNIFLCGAPLAGEEGVKVKLLDFGIAQVADGLHQRTGSNMMLGTPAYMSPEQCQGGRVDFRADIYALGVVSFEVLTGAQPFRGTNAMQLMSKHLTAEPPAPSELLPSIAPQVDAAVLAMLAKRPENRPASASAAIRALATSAQLSDSSATPSVAPPSARSAGGTPPVRRATRLALLGGLLIAAAVFVLLAWGNKTGSAVEPDAPGVVTQAEPRSQPAGPPLEPRASAAAAFANAPELVILTIYGVPGTAKIFRGNAELGKVGQPFRLPRSEQPLSLSVRAPGYLSRELEVVPSRNQELDVKLAQSSRKRRNPDLEY